MIESFYNISARSCKFPRSATCNNPFAKGFLERYFAKRFTVRGCIGEFCQVTISRGCSCLSEKRNAWLARLRHGEALHNSYRQLQACALSILRIDAPNCFVISVGTFCINEAISWIPISSAHRRFEVFEQGRCFARGAIKQEQALVERLRHLSFGKATANAIKGGRRAFKQNLFVVRAILPVTQPRLIYEQGIDCALFEPNLINILVVERLSSQIVDILTHENALSIVRNVVEVYIFFGEGQTSCSACTQVHVVECASTAPTCLTVIGGFELFEHPFGLLNIFVDKVNSKFTIGRQCHHSFWQICR